MHLQLSNLDAARYSSPDQAATGTKRLAIVCLPGPRDREELAARFAGAMGIESQIVVIDASADPFSQIQEWPLDNSCVAMTADTLAILHRLTSDPDDFRRILLQRGAEMLVFGCDEPIQQSAALTWLSAGTIEGIGSSDRVSGIAPKFRFPASGRAFSRHFAGLDFESGPQASSARFAFKNQNTVDEVLSDAEGGSVCVCIQLPSSRIFLIAGSRIPDIDDPVSRNGQIESQYDQILPFLIFFRSFFPRESWRGLAATARLVIDDPLLADRYGLLDYGALARSMDCEQYGTTIAFIPWNYRRSSPQWIQKTLRSDMNLSVCIHGCDHSNREFETSDQKILMHKAKLALDRMESHRRRTGMPFEPVMVFPQGRFSTCAISALRANQYLAAVNTSGFAFDGASTELRIRDFLRPAITRYSGFPIFLRRYPTRAIDCAFDLFLGKPAILVEHHQYFGDGCAALEDFVRALYQIEPELSWPSLSAQLTRACLVKQREVDSLDVQFFTREFQISNSGHQRCRYLFRKDEPDPSFVRAVVVNGKALPFERRNDRIEFELDAEPGETVLVDVEDNPSAASDFTGFGVSYQTRVFLRRRLSEFRDNTLSRHPTVLAAAKRLARSLKLTGAA